MCSERFKESCYAHARADVFAGLVTPHSDWFTSGLADGIWITDALAQAALSRRHEPLIDAGLLFRNHVHASARNYLIGPQGTRLVAERYEALIHALRPRE